MQRNGRCAGKFVRRHVGRVTAGQPASRGAGDRPCFSLFDVYTDIAFPGGIHAAWFTDTWGRYNEALDRNALHEVVGWWAKLR